jgi:hypothetical protein
MIFLSKTALKSDFLFWTAIRFARPVAGLPNELPTSTSLFCRPSD